jgi:hypothetical protein
MRKIVLIVSLMIIALSLNACQSSVISNDRLKEDILSIKELDLISSVKEMTIIEKNETSTSLDYKLSTTLESSGFSATADITLEYTKKDSKWVLKNSSLNIINISAKYEPAFTSVVKGAIEKVSHGLINHPLLIGLSPTYNLVSQSGSKEEGFLSMVITEAFSDDILSIDIVYSVEASYNIQSGWNITLKDWMYTETMNWEGTYDLEWLVPIPGYPSGELSKYFVVGDTINDIKISGGAVVVKRMDQPEEIQNTLRLQYQYKGKEINVQPIFEDSSNIIHFTVNPDDIDNSTLYFQYNSHRKGSIDTSYRAYECYEPFMYGNLIKQP